MQGKYCVALHHLQHLVVFQIHHLQHLVVFHLVSNEDCQFPTRYLGFEGEPIKIKKIFQFMDFGQNRQSIVKYDFN